MKRTVAFATAAILLTGLGLTACSGGTSGGSGSGPKADLSVAAQKIKDLGYPQVAAAVTSAKAGPGPLKDGTTFKLADRIKAKVDSGKPVNYVSSEQSSGIAVFSSQYKAGFDASLIAAKSILPMNGKLIGPSNGTDIPTQIQQIQALLNTGQIDCLSINPPDPAAFTDVINQAVSKGIPVFTANIAGEGNEFTDFAQISEKEGKTAGAAVVTWMKDHHESLSTFAITSGDPTALWALGRMKGFIETIRAAVPDAKFVTGTSAPLSVTYDPSKSYDAYKALLNGNPELQFILNVDVTGEQASRAVEDAGRTGEVFTAGWNVSDGQLDAIEKGVQVAAFDQGFGEQGAFGGMACATYLATGKVAPNTQQLIVVGKDQVADARAALKKASE